MPPNEAEAPAKLAIRLTHLLDAAFGAETRFPVNVVELAKAIGSQLRLEDQITQVQAANLDSFEGGLFHLENGQWALLYNESLISPGRIRFTQAHELGHFLAHRTLQKEFHCSQAQVAGYEGKPREIEDEANVFASTLLMPIKQFRASLAGQPIDLEMLSEASKKFGVSLTAACLRWIRSTEESAVLVLSRDGFIDWSISSDKAFDNGVYIKSRVSPPVEVPSGSLTADCDAESSRTGKQLSLSTWFPHAHRDASLREMKLDCDNYGYTLSLLHLSSTDKAWAPRDWAQRL